MKKVLLLGAVLVSLSLSVTSVIAAELKAVDSVKFSVEHVVQEASIVESKDSPINVVEYISVGDTIHFERSLNVTGENTLTEFSFDNYSESNSEVVSLVAANSPFEVGWRF